MRMSGELRERPNAPRIGWLVPEDEALPVVESRGSISDVIWQLASRLADRYEIVFATRPHPVLGGADMELDGIRYVRTDAAQDRARGELLHRLNQVQRRLGLRDLPYAGRSSYFRGYASRHASRFRREGVALVNVHNNSQWIPVLRRALPTAPIVLHMHCEWLAEIPYSDGLARLRQVDKVLGVSEQIAQQIRERFPEEADKVGVLRHGIDTSVFPAGRRNARPARNRGGGASTPSWARPGPRRAVPRPDLAGEGTARACRGAAPAARAGAGCPGGLLRCVRGPSQPAAVARPA